MILEQAFIPQSLVGLDKLLDNVNADFTGSNGEEFYCAKGVSYLEYYSKAVTFYNMFTKLDYIINKCREDLDSSDLFEYEIEEVHDFVRGKGYVVSIAYHSR